jgi:tRNA pseudouridine55 synthase
MNGALIIDKPSGPTSHDVVARVRRALRTPRVGHTGTLDPLATGVLVLLLGKATRLAQFLVADDKEYQADVQLGIETPTYDAASLPDGWRPDARRAEPGEVERAVAVFRGTFLQTPPPFSAKKIAGRRAYEDARRQRPVELRPVEVTVHALELIACSDTGLLSLRVVCGSGFYVRSLAHDIGRRLGWGAHLARLRRTRSGRFRVEDAVTLDEIERGVDVTQRLLPPKELLSAVLALTLTDEGVRRVSHGNWIAPEHLRDSGVTGGSPGRVRLLDGSGGLTAVAERGADGLLHPLVVLV